MALTPIKEVCGFFIEKKCVLKNEMYAEEIIQHV